MTPYHKLLQARKYLKDIERAIELFNKKTDIVLQSDLFKKSVTNMDGASNKLESLKKEGLILQAQLNTLLKKGKKSYAPKVEERSNGSFQGAYGNLLGDIRKNSRSLDEMLRHLDFLIATIKNTNNENTRTLVATAAYVKQEIKQKEKFGNQADASDFLTLAVTLAAVIKKGVQLFKN